MIEINFNYYIKRREYRLNEKEDYLKDFDTDDHHMSGYEFCLRMKKGRISSQFYRNYYNKKMGLSGYEHRL